MAYTLTVIDAGGIQDFIFGSNELRENIGASDLVYRVTTRWVKEALDVSGETHNVCLGPDGVALEYSDAKRIEDQASGLTVEVLYAGGGNAVLLFAGDDSRSRAEAFVYALSKRALTDVPGLNVYAAHDQYDWASPTQSLPHLVQQTLARLGRYKDSRPGPLPQLGLGVTAACGSTGLPAYGLHPEDRKPGADQYPKIASREVIAKYNAATAAVDRLRALFPDVEQSGFLWTDDLDRIGRLPGRDESYIAVVHADGNGMGRRIQALANKHSQPDAAARVYINAMRQLSRGVATTATVALQSTVRALVEHLSSPAGNGQFGQSEGNKVFPFRPIVFGGDDVTFVAAGPWGLALAARYLSELERQPALHDGQHLFGCAGVAIVKTHYPIARAYHLSEQLVGSAKDRIVELVSDKQASAIDWHFTTSGLSGDLDQIREREYRTDHGWLIARPLMLGTGYGWRNWDEFRGLVLTLQHDWLDKRNKVVALRDALRSGPTATEQFRVVFEPALYDRLSVTAAKFRHGWVAEQDGLIARCAYFDAVEIANLFFDLPTPK